jgi:hypothetical protein
MTPEEEALCEWVAFSVATCSFICSVFTLMLIKRLNQWNGYHLIIFSLTIGQILYDINYMLGVLPGEFVCKTWQFLDVAGGLSMTLWSNVLGACVLHVALRIKSANIKKRFPKFLVVGALFPLSVAFLQICLDAIEYDGNRSSCQYSDNAKGQVARGLYYWCRLASIIVNVAIYVSITLKIRNIVTTAKGDQKDALTELAGRMKYYPLLQALSRSGAAWDEFNRTGDSGYFPSSLMRSICSPSSGIWYFLIFLLMQPGVLEHAKDILHEAASFFCFSSHLSPHTDSRDTLALFGKKSGVRGSELTGGSGRVSLTGSQTLSDGHQRPDSTDGQERKLFRSTASDGSLVMTNESGEELFRDSVDRVYASIRELDEDELESIITDPEGRSTRLSSTARAYSRTKSGVSTGTAKTNNSGAAAEKV